MLATGVLKTGELYKRFLGLSFYGKIDRKIQNIIDAVIDVIREDLYLSKLCENNNINIVFYDYAINRLNAEYVFVKANIDEIDPDGLYWCVVESLIACEWHARGIKLNHQVFRRVKNNVDRRIRKWELDNPV